MPKSPVFRIALAIAVLALIAVFVLDSPTDHTGALAAGAVAAIAGCVAMVSFQMARAGRPD